MCICTHTYVHIHIWETERDFKEWAHMILELRQVHNLQDRLAGWSPGVVSIMGGGLLGPKSTDLDVNFILKKYIPSQHYLE